jgi:hypothetical protein
LPFQLDATPGDFIFDPHGAGTLDIGGGDHAALSLLDWAA